MLDDKDRAILAARVAKWDTRPGPRVGDFCLMPMGDLRRFTHDWGDDIQTTCEGQGFGASFYFDRNGYCDFSGGLDSAIPKARLRETDRFEDGAVWFFHHDMARAHNGVTAAIRCRVYEVR